MTGTDEHRESDKKADLAMKLMTAVGKQSKSTVRVHARLTFPRQQFVSSHYADCQERLLAVVAQRQADRAAVLLLDPAEHLLVAEQLNTRHEPLSVSLRDAATCHRLTPTVTAAIPSSKFRHGV